MTKLKNDDRREIYKALSLLNERQSSVITRKYFRNFNNRQISGLTGINASTVSAHGTRAIEKIRLLMNVSQAAS